MGRSKREVKALALYSPCAACLSGVPALWNNSGLVEPQYHLLYIHESLFSLAQHSGKCKGVTFYHETLRFVLSCTRFWLTLPRGYGIIRVSLRIGRLFHGPEPGIGPEAGGGSEPRHKLGAKRFGAENLLREQGSCPKPRDCRVLSQEKLRSRKSLPRAGKLSETERLSSSGKRIRSKKKVQ